MRYGLVIVFDGKYVQPLISLLVSPGAERIGQT